MLNATDAHSVSPIASTTEIPKRCSNARCCSGGRGADADANLALSADRLIYKDVKTGAVRLSLQLKDSAARLTLEDMLLYDGRGRGVVTLDGRGQAPATTLNLMLEGIAAQPLLKDALGFEWLAGQSTIAVALAGQGVSERQIVTTLNGKIDLATNNGTIEAVDVGKILRGIEQGRFGGLRVAPRPG